MSRLQTHHTTETDKNGETIPPYDTPAYTRYLLQNPEHIVGNSLIAMCVKRGWNPDGYEHLQHISERNVRESKETENGVMFIYEAEQHIGKITSYNPETDTYSLSLEGEFPQETGEWPCEHEWVETTLTIPAKVVRQKLATGNHPETGEWYVSPT